MDAVEHSSQRARHTGDALEGCGVHRVHADGNSVQAGPLQIACHAGEQVAVRGQRKVERLAFIGGVVVGIEGRADGAQIPDEVEQTGTQQGFTAGQPHLLDAEVDHQPDHRGIVRNRKLGAAKSMLASPAVDAAIVATIGDGDPQVGDRTAEAVAQTRRQRHALQRGNRERHRTGE